MSATVTDYIYVLYNGQTFFGEERIGLTCVMIFHMHMHDWVELERQIENKFEVNSNHKTVTRNATQFQPAVTFLSEIKILRSTHR
jgi:hypothetical protein